MNLCVTEEKFVKRSGQESRRHQTTKKRSDLNSALQMEAADVVILLL